MQRWEKFLNPENNKGKKSNNWVQTQLLMLTVVIRTLDRRRGYVGDQIG